MSLSVGRPIVSAAVALGPSPGPNGFDAAQENSRRQTLRRLPAIEIVAVVPGENDKVLLGQIVVDPHRRGKTPKERQRGPLRHVTKDDRPFGILELKHATCELVSACV